MKSEKLNRYRSWLLSGGIIIVVLLWLASGQFRQDAPEPVGAIQPAAAASAQRNAVRVRTQTAEKVMRTIVVNGETAPSRVVHLAAETDGRIEYVGAERGAALQRGDVIVRLDERDRSARLAQAKASGATPSR